MTFAEGAGRFGAELAAVRAADADRRLAGMLGDPALSAWDRIGVAVALGDHRGAAGSAALRRAFAAAVADLAAAGSSTRSRYCDLACACVVALARRDGPAATDVYVVAAGSPSTGVRGYGLAALAAFVDDRAWEQILAWVTATLRRKFSPSGMGGHARSRDTYTAIEYLARHAGQGTDRAARLIVLLRDRWHHMAHDARLAGAVERSWPGIEPGGLPVAELDLPGLHTPRFFI